jgi:hypothetical protein
MFIFVPHMESGNVDKNLFEGVGSNINLIIKNGKSADFFTVFQQKKYLFISDRMLEAFQKSQLIGLDIDNVIPVSLVLESEVNSYPFPIKPKFQELFLINISENYGDSDIFIIENGICITSLDFIAFLKRFVLGSHLIAPFNTKNDQNLFHTKDSYDLKKLYSDTEYYKFIGPWPVSTMSMEGDIITEIILDSYPGLINTYYSSTGHLVMKLFYEKYLKADLKGILSFIPINKDVIRIDEECILDPFEIPDLYKVLIDDKPYNNDIFILNGRLIVNYKFIDFINSFYHDDMASFLSLYWIRIQQCEI